MKTVNKIIGIFGYQLHKSDVKLPKNSVKSPKIQDNNQAINNGAINESEPKSNLRSKAKTQQVLSRRSKRSA